MNLITRVIISGPGAFVVTTGLALIMAKMIYVPFTDLPDKPEAMSFVINPEIIDEVISPKIKPEALKRITPPPAPPIIDRQTPSLPTESIATFDTAIPDFDRPKLDPQTIVLVISDVDAKPLVRIEPIMPPRAQKSGHCKVRFNVTAQGQPYEVEATYCTQAVFKRPTIKSVEKWKYNPKIHDGMAVARRGVESQITFKLTDEHGRPIPE